MNTKQQLRVLYRQFLFRVFDLEALSAQAQGNANQLMGQFAALLVFVSATVSLFALMADSSPKADPTDRTPALLATMIAQHLLIATTMLVVGLFAVLSWDTTFPDRRDVLVLAPLPVQGRTMFPAKVAATASALMLSILLLHSGMGLVLPVIFAEHAAPATVAAMTFDPTPVAITAPDLKSVMDRDLRQALTTGELAPRTGLGLAIGAWKHGERTIFTYGPVKKDSIFEIGSVTKTFTGLMLARMVTEGKVRLDEPVRELLPPGTVKKPAGPEITLLDLATHRSGLPPIPDNYDYTESRPFENYGTDRLYAWLSMHGVAKPEDATFVYSNLGMGLLGHALALRAGRSYADLLRDEITGPLGMNDTVVKISDEQKPRFLQGHNQQHRPGEPLVFDVLAGAGEIHSTAGDMMTYLEANLHPRKYAALSSPLALSHEIRATGSAGQKIALAWAYSPENGTWWHNGGTTGFTSYAFFDPHGDCAAVVLLNSGANTLLAVDQIGEHIRQRLMGEPAISLNNVIVPADRGFFGWLRQFGTYWFTMIAAGLFTYGAILGFQGLAALLLPRRLFLRISGYLQLAVAGVILGLYFMQPGFGGLDDLAFGSIYRVTQLLPSYWFLGLYQQLNGSAHPALQPLAHRAWLGMAGVFSAAPVIYALCFRRTLRKIIEEPDIMPGTRGLRWLPAFGNRPQTAIGQFAVRALVRSRQHRMILAFYLGIGLAIISLMVKEAAATTLNNTLRQRSLMVWAASLVMILLAVVGTRASFALPLDLRANWVFRIIGVRAGVGTVAASRRALVLLSIVPVWAATAVACIWLRLGRQNIGHLFVLGLFGMIIADICFLRFRRIPFTCSWLPGKSHINIVFVGAFFLLMMGPDAVMLERNALRNTTSMFVMLLIIAVVWACVSISTSVLANRGGEELQFEDEAPPDVQGLGLYRDGVMTIDKPPGI